MEVIERELREILAQRRGWAGLLPEGPGLLEATDAQRADSLIHRLAADHRGAVEPMREARIARARGLAQAIAECRDDARLNGIREGAAEIVTLLGGSSTMANIERSEAEPTVPARLLDDVRVSMKALLEQNVNAWTEVDRLHEQLRGAVVVDEAAVERVAKRLMSLPPDMLTAEPYKAAGALLAAAAGGQ